MSNWDSFTAGPSEASEVCNVRNHWRVRHGEPRDTQTSARIIPVNYLNLPKKQCHWQLVGSRLRAPTYLPPSQLVRRPWCPPATARSQGSIPEMVRKINRNSSLLPFHQGFHGKCGINQPSGLLMFDGYDFLVLNTIETSKTGHNRWTSSELLVLNRWFWSTCFTCNDMSWTLLLDWLASASSVQQYSPVTSCQPLM